MKQIDMDSSPKMNLEKLLVFKLIQKLYLQNTKELGDLPAVQLNAAVLAAGHAGFDDLLSTGKDHAFQYINESLSTLTISVKNTNGLLYQYTGCGFLALYEQKAEHALKAALQICGCLSAYATGAVSLCFGNSMIGMIGAEDAYMPVVISDMAGLSDFLQKTAPKYSAYVLASGSFVDRIANFRKRYLHRFLGYLYIRSKDAYEKLYDIFQGDPAEMHILKRKTRLMFEEGVRLFYLFQYKIARRHFIEVLKVFQNDKASRHYLKLCDACLEEEPQNRKVLYIEIYENGSGWIKEKN